MRHVLVKQLCPLISWWRNHWNCIWPSRDAMKARQQHVPKRLVTDIIWICTKSKLKAHIRRAKTITHTSIIYEPVEIAFSCVYFLCWFPPAGHVMRVRALALLRSIGTLAHMLWGHTHTSTNKWLWSAVGASDRVRRQHRNANLLSAETLPCVHFERGTQGKAKLASSFILYR